MDDYLFKYKQLSDFEKLLFCEKENKELKIAIGKYQSSIEEIFNDKINLKKQIKVIENTVSQLQKRIKELNINNDSIIIERESSLANKLKKTIRRQSKLIESLKLEKAEILKL